MTASNTPPGGNEVVYCFHDSTSCNMCGADIEECRILGIRMNKSQGKKPSSLRGITVTILKCKQCGLVFPDPMPLPLQLADHYDVPPEDYWNEDYFSIDEGYMSAQIKTLKKLMPGNPKIRSLDIGAGLGKAMIAFENAGIEAFGFEPSSTFYQRALEKMNIDSSRLQHSSIESAVYSDESFDFISFGAVLEHLPDPAAAIQKAMKWLKKDGLIYLEIPSSDWLIGRLANIYYRITGTRYIGNLSPFHTPYHLYEFTLKSFLKNAERQGHTVAYHLYHVVPEYTFLPAFLKPLFIWIMKKFNSGMQLEVWLKK